MENGVLVAAEALVGDAQDVAQRGFDICVDRVLLERTGGFVEQFADRDVALAAVSLLPVATMFAVFPATTVAPAGTTTCEVASELPTATEMAICPGLKSPRLLLVSVVIGPVALPIDLMITASPASIMPPVPMLTLAFASACA